MAYQPVVGGSGDEILCRIPPFIPQHISEKPVWGAMTLGK
jgi:hypothetical protein